MFKKFSFSSPKTQEKEKTLFFRKIKVSPESDAALNIKKALWIIKLILYGFSFLMILWSFIQSFAEPYTNYSAEPGSGLEFGFFPGGTYKTGNYKYDLFSLEINPLNYHAFFMPTVKYGPFLSCFVYPFAYVFLNLIYGLGQASTFLETSGLNVVFAIIVMLCFMRSLSFFVTLRGAYYAEKQYSHKPHIDKISKKYVDSDLQSKNKKQSEINIYNKKHNLKPFAQLENFFIITPIFLITFKIITIMRPIKFTVLCGIWHLSKTPVHMIFNNFLDGGWAYLLLCLVIIPVNFVSQKIPMWLTKRRNSNVEDPNENNPYFESTKKIQTILTVVFLLFCFFWSTGLAVYYFFNSLFTIAQSFGIHKLLLKWKTKKNTFDDELKKFGIN